MGTQTAWWREPTRGQWFSFLGAWMGWVLDAFDFTVFLVVMPNIAKEFGVGTLSTTGSIALTLMARLVGGYLAGAAADRWGRKLPLMISIIWFAICDGLIAFAPSFTMILVLRTLFGFGMGAEWTSGTALAMENWPKRSRGIASGILQGSWALGYLAVGPVAAYVVPNFGWRTLFLIAAAPAVLVLFIRFAVPESEEWTKAKAVKRSEGSLASAFTFSRGVVPRLVWGCFAMAAGLGVYYALTGLYPTMLKTQLGFSEGGVGRLVVLFNLGMLVGSVTTGWLASRRGSALAIGVPALLAVPLIPLYVGASDLGAVVGGLFGVGFCGVTPLLLTELFPAEERARLIGIAYHVGSAMAAFIPMGIAGLAEYAHIALSSAIAVVAIACELVIAALVLGRRLARRAAEAALASAE